MPKCDKYHAKWKAHMAKGSKYHAKCKVTMPKCSKYMQIPCSKMAGSSSKLLQIQGKWYWERKPKKNIQNLRQRKIPKLLFYLFYTPWYMSVYVGYKWI